MTSDPHQPDDVARGRLADVPGFTRVWAASSASAVGTYVTTLAVQVIVVETLRAGATGSGLVNAARWLPYLLLGLVAGVLVERSPRRPVMVAADLGRGVVLAAVPVLAVTERLSLPLLTVLMAAFGLLSLFGDAASQAFLPRLVPRGLLTAANARFDQSDAVAQTSGPALGGLLVALVTAPWAVLVDAVSYLVSGVLLLGVRVREPARRSLSLRGVRGEAAEGLRWVYRHATLRPVALGTHGWFLCSAVAGAVLPAYALDTLGLSAFGFGLVLAAAGVGALAGSSVSVRLGDRFGAGRVVIACQAAASVAWALVALGSPHPLGWVVLGLGQLVLGVSMGAENANSMGFRQAVTPDALQGRTNATMRSVNRAMIVVGAPLGGILGDAVGFRPVLWAAAAGFLLVALALAASPVRHARVD